MISSLAPGLVALLAALPAVAEPKGDLLFRTDYRGHSITVLDDGTWHFTDPDTSLADITPFKEGGCLAAAEGRIAYCGLPEGFTADAVISSYGNQEFGFTDRATHISFSVTLDTTYGHHGDIEYYESMGSGAETFANKLIGYLTGFEIDAERAFARDGIVVVESGFRIETELNEGANLSIEVLSESNSLTVNTSAYGSQSDGPAPDLTDTIARLTANLTIDGTPLPEWKAEAR